MALEVKRGDTLAWDCTYWSDSGGTIPLDLTGLTLASAAKHTSGVAQVLTVAVTGAPAGTFTLSATAAQTAAMPLGDWSVDIERTDGAGVVKSTETFIFALDEDITNA